MPDIHIIGDSHTVFLTLDDKFIKYETFSLAKGYARKVIGDSDINLHYHVGKTAYNSGDFFNTLGDIGISKNSRLFFQFGAVDIQTKLPKYNNAEAVVKRYVKACLDYSAKYGLKPRFIQPVTGIQFTKYILQFEETLRSECLKYGLESPIEVYGVIVDRDFPSQPWDDKWHMTQTDNEKLLNYLVSIA